MTNGRDNNAFDPWACASHDALQRMTDLARRVLKARTALLSSFDADQQIVLCSSGYSSSEGSIPLADSVCNRMMRSGQALVAPVVGEHPLLKDLDAQDELGAYLGVPVRLSDGRILGALCVTDSAPHAWNGDDLDLIGELAGCMASQIELDRENVRREAAEAALRAGHARFRSVADNIPGLVFERRKVNQSGVSYAFFGSRKTRLTSVREMMETGINGDLAFIHPEDRDAFRAALLRATIEETDLDLTFRAFDDDGVLRWLRSQSKIRHQEQGVPESDVTWDGICIDITELVTAREEAEAARAANDLVLVNVSHELRTPLQAIMGFSDFLVTETDPSLVAAHAKNIKIAAHSVLAIVNQLLDLAGAEADAASHHLETVDLAVLADTCLSMVGPKAIEKMLATTLVIDSDVPAQVAVDRQKLQQALLNLLNNSVKFTDTGGVTLQIAHADEGLRFNVIDTGIGIKPEERDRLFQRFSRIGPDARDGTGLGLSITKALVESMKGSIGVSSNAGRGTTFWFEIPVDATSTAPKSSPPVGEPQLPIETPSLVAGARILLADDLDLNRKLISDMLSIEGHIVDCVADGAAAVTAASANAYDLIFMDMIMPVMDGIAATRAIRAMPAPACDVPIVALTANSFRDQLDSCLRAGMDATLTKPMSIDDLTRAVSTWTRGRPKAA